ncbi:MAG: threonine aldolase [Marivirga sp.]|jgi:threonine aldolase
MNLIDLRSDTVTKASAAMKAAMLEAEVGDDVFQEDPSVKKLEEQTAKYFGMEEGLFCPSGTMTNQIAIRVHTQPQSEVICDEKSHIYLYEGGGIAYNSFSSVRLLKGDGGRLNAGMIKDNINDPDDIHAAKTSLVSLENTVNKGGGCYYDFAEIQRIAAVCKENELPLHLDGARLFNAIVASGDDPLLYGKAFDTISICFSKGLGCPVGSVLIGSREHIREGRRIRKVLGGGMRQAGILAAAGSYALMHHVERLRDDHHRAKILANALKGLPFVDNVLPADTNIVIFRLANSELAKSFVLKLEKIGILAVPFGKHDVRFVTHLDFNDVQLEQTIDLLRGIV